MYKHTQFLCLTLPILICGLTSCNPGGTLDPKGVIEVRGDSKVFSLLNFSGNIPGATSFIWDFGDGTQEEVEFPHSYIDRVHAPHAYDRSGDFLVKLIGFHDSEIDTVSKLIYIQPSPFTPIADLLVGTYQVSATLHKFYSPGACGCPETNGDRCSSTEPWADTIINVFRADRDSALKVECTVENRSIFSSDQDWVQVSNNGGETSYVFAVIGSTTFSSSSKFIVTQDSIFMRHSFTKGKSCQQTYSEGGYKIE